MDQTTLLALIFLVFFLLLLFSGWLIAFCMAATCLLAYFFMAGGTIGNFAYLGYAAVSNYYWLALPIFILMGEILIHGGVAERLYDAVLPLMSRVPGGLIHTNVIANTILGACCGSTIAATSATSTVAIPELHKRGYQKGICYGSLAAAGNLAGLIPPSIGLIVFASITVVSLGKLFIAGIIPGLLLATALIVVSAIWVRVRPETAPHIKKEEIIPLGKASVIAMRHLWPLLILIVVVLGSIYTGFATPTESGCYGVVGALILGARRLNRKKIKDALFATAQVGGGLLFLLVMAQIYGFAIGRLGLRDLLLESLVVLPGTPAIQMYLVWLMLLLLGMFLDAGSVMVITTPILLPFAVSLGFDPVWYGIWLVLAIELGNITPPVGLTLYAVQAVSREDLMVVARGCFPYWASFIATMMPLTFSPIIVLWLPGLMF